MGGEIIGIRDAKRKDAEGIARVHEAAWRSTYQGIIPHLHLEKIIAHRGPGWWERSLTRGRTETLILTYQDQPQGYVSFGAARALRTGATGEIFELYLAPSFQGLGLGKRLFVAAHQALKKRGHSSLIVWSLAENESACAFYGRLGGARGAIMPENYGSVTLHRVAFLWPQSSRSSRAKG